MAYVCTPLLYCAAAYLLTALIAYPFVSGALSLASFAVSQRAAETPVSGEEIVSLSDVTDGVINSADIHFPNFGEQLGTLTVTHADGSAYIEAPLWFGDEKEQLKNGVGVFYGSSAPGYGSTVLIAGHNHTYFKPLKGAEVGDTVTVNTYYGVYVYEITAIEVKQVTDTSHYDLLADNENLLMYTCWPFGSIGMTPTRLFLYGRYVSGPMVNYRG